ncbi:MAG: radical SAM protein [Oscillospiraceae bacterium]|nr:radical SAM protein [Oscillospiraceae bacterium]
MSLPHANISIFVPHIGCPNRCSFCNQRYITGAHMAPPPIAVADAVIAARSAKNYSPENTEIAFFGGSFTAINRNYMLELLKAAAWFVENGIVSGIRISTRPDAINEEILKLLKQYHVTAIELGAQSMRDRVLKMNNRGHTSDDVVNASALIRKYGFSLGLQMMTGLYKDSDTAAISTAKQIIKIKPDTVRIYPTIVLKDTYLAALYSDNKYQPQTLDEAVSLASELLEMFLKADIKVIRLGLHSIEEDSYVAGPWHPAFSELCKSALYYKRLREMLKVKGKYTVFVAPKFVSQMVGQKRTNIEKLKSEGFNCKVKTDDTLKEYEIRVEGKVE